MKIRRIVRLLVLKTVTMITLLTTLQVVVGTAQPHRERSERDIITTEIVL